MITLAGNPLRLIGALGHYLLPPASNCRALAPVAPGAGADGRGAHGWRTRRITPGIIGMPMTECQTRDLAGLRRICTVAACMQVL